MFLNCLMFYYYNQCCSEYSYTFIFVCVLTPIEVSKSGISGSKGMNIYGFNKILKTRKISLVVILFDNKGLLLFVHSCIYSSPMENQVLPA